MEKPAEYKSLISQTTNNDATEEDGMTGKFAASRLLYQGSTFRCTAKRRFKKQIVRSEAQIGFHICRY